MSAKKISIIIFCFLLTCCFCLPVSADTSYYTESYGEIDAYPYVLFKIEPTNNGEYWVTTYNTDHIYDISLNMNMTDFYNLAVSYLGSQSPSVSLLNNIYTQLYSSISPNVEYISNLLNGWYSRYQSDVTSLLQSVNTIEDIIVSRDVAFKQSYTDMGFYKISPLFLRYTNAGGTVNDFLTFKNAMARDNYTHSVSVEANERMFCNLYTFGHSGSGIWTMPTSSSGYIGHYIDLCFDKPVSSFTLYCYFQSLYNSNYAVTMYNSDGFSLDSSSFTGTIMKLNFKSSSSVACNLSLDIRVGCPSSYSGNYSVKIVPQNVVYYDAKKVEKEETQNSANSAKSSADSAIDNKSSSMTSSIQALAQSMSYNGTACTLSVPSLTWGLDGIIPETTWFDDLEIDFTYYINKFVPTTIMSIIRALTTIALVVFCFKELYDLISLVLVNKKAGDD